MIKVENISVMNFENAIRGMRNPLESWEQNDSYYIDLDEYRLGENDIALALKLIKAGNDHSKFLRQILISMDITAPLYFWKEYDTYKVSTVSNSTSTMHKLHTRKLTENDFSFDIQNGYTDHVIDHLNSLIEDLKKCEINSSEYKMIWRMLIQHLPSSFNQMRTWTGNYQNLRNIYHARKNHKLQEWKDFCEVIESLPYSEFITT